MFYRSIESAYRAGQVRIGRLAQGHGERVTIEAKGLVRIKVACLSRGERRRLSELAKADAVAFRASRNEKSEAMLAEYRHALNGALGFPEGEAFELLCLDYLGSHSHAGVAWSLEQGRLHLLFGSTNRPEPDYEPFWLLEMAKELTEFFRTLVVPDQASTQISIWAGVEHGPIVSYRFKLTDATSSLTI